MTNTKCIISCDWGTSSFRLRLVELNSGNILSEYFDKEGIAKTHTLWKQENTNSLNREDFYTAFLIEKIKKIGVQNEKEMPVLISGMASSSIGIKELPYSDAPFDLSGSSLNFFSIKNHFHIHIFSGVKTDSDVMRGEESILLGCDFQEEEHVILPGTHSKHAFVKNNILTDFKTFMTGEFFDLLCTNSILNASIKKPEKMNLENPFYLEGLRTGFKGNLLNAAFLARTHVLIKGISMEDNYHFLSGLLIGSELQAIPEKTKLIHLVSEGALMEVYRYAFQILNFDSEIKYTDSTKALIKGHIKLAARI